MSAATASYNVMPNWWTIPFIILEISILVPFAWDSFFHPSSHFKSILRRGQDKETDNIGSSPRVTYHGSVAGLFFAGSLALILSATFFARNDLAGMPALQEKLMRRVIWVTFVVDSSPSTHLNPLHIPSSLCLSESSNPQPIWYFILWRSIPHPILFDPPCWSPKLRGIIIGAPLAGAFKLAWLMGVGRDAAR